MPFILVPEPGREVCDFCGRSPTARLFACHNFALPNTKQQVFTHESIGAWSACDICSRLIQEGKWTLLTNRAVRKFLKRHNVPSYEAPDVREQLREIHMLFKKHMIPDA